MSHAKLLTVAGVPPDLHPQALASLTYAQGRSRGLFAAKLKTRLFRAGRIAKAMPWDAERLIDVRPDWADDDIAPMLNITGHGDNGPWVFPEGGGIDTGRPAQHYWLNPDPASAEYQEAVAKCYWAKGHHPRSQKARKSWYRRNGGEYRAWRLGVPVDPSLPVERWQGRDGRLSVSVVRCGDAWIVNTERRLIGRLSLHGRYGFEVDNVFSGQFSPQMWFPIPGYELRAPVTWSTVPRWEK
ncbi:hypothetical protein [Pulveribacter sp.]|uniref:hypothetical protein n=1 Tax=Pulveribacter sp. TaxID=2678893 RepID=UPI0028A7281E|nr:hypothetical protein [Pulveribacter sp.]